ncbi:hypothetical protein [Hyphomonas neptunium]|uniref:hypothetical protein n=1 Tax=Hyphomonas neptunium TaxID=81032 RepID=UPI000AEF89A5|nr:hypothetical protein [Hyphomonas neptunium]
MAAAGAPEAGDGAAAGFGAAAGAGGGSVAEDVPERLPKAMFYPVVFIVLLTEQFLEE